MLCMIQYVCIVYFIHNRQHRNLLCQSRNHVSTGFITQKAIRSAQFHNMFLINNTGCTVPDVNLFDQSFEAFLDKNPKMKNCSDNQVVTYIKDGIIYINNTKLPNEAAYCELIPISGKGGLPNYGEPFRFYKSAKVNGEFLKVNCYSRDSNFHFNFVHKNDNYSANTQSNPTNQPNVLLIMLESTSRINSLRYFKKTRDYLENEIGAIEMLGYHKIADNTRPNMGALLTNEHGKNACYLRAQEVDKCSWIWNEYSIYHS